MPCQTQEAPNISWSRGSVPFSHSLNLLGVNFNSLTRHNMPQESNSIKPEFILGKFCIQFMIFEGLKDDSEVIGIIFLTLRINQNVINEDYNKQIQKLKEHPIHKVHEGCRSISQSKGGD